MKKIYAYALLTISFTQIIAMERPKAMGLAEAAYRENLDAVKKLLAEGANPDEKDIWGADPLFCAVCEGHNDVVEALLISGANVSELTKGRTPLYFAASLGHTDIVQTLLKNGAIADINRSAFMRMTPLHVAASFGYIGVMALLLAYGAEIDSVQSPLHQTALQTAITRGNKAAAIVLLDKGADVNNVDDLGETALQIASRFGYADMAKLLLKKGARVNTTHPRDLDRRRHDVQKDDFGARFILQP